MTGTYEWNPMPHVLDISCPSCGGRASFEFAEVVRIKRRVDLDFFKESPFFEYRFFEEAWAGTSWHGALFFPGLESRTADAAAPLPEGYSASDWEHGRYLYRSHGLDLGVAACSSCGTREKHRLDWPKDAYYQVQHRGSLLWAFHRESAAELRDFVSSDERSREGYKWQSFLLHIPHEFLTRKARQHVVKCLDRLLKGA